MTKTVKISIGIGLLASLVGVVVLLGLCMYPVVARVSIPGSSMTAVVHADLAACYDVQLFEHGQPVPGGRLCLGPYVSGRCSLAQMSTASNIVTIVWTDGGRPYSTEVDIAAKRFVAFSNGVPIAYSNGVPAR